MRSLVSILIPAHNAQRWIADTLNSAISQSWEHKEIIVVDDGSTDETVNVARRFESRGVKVFCQPNQGAAAARNKAYSLCNGDYIQWLDADDLLSTHKIRRQMEVATALGNPRILFSAPWTRFMYRWYRADFSPSALWCDLSPTEWLFRKLDLNLSMQTATWLTSHELADDAGAWDSRLVGDDDGEYFCRVLLASEGVRFVPDAFVYYRGPALTDENLSFIQRSPRRLNAEWLSMQLHISYLRSKEDSTRVRDACLGYLQRYLAYFFPLHPEITSQMETVAKELGGSLTPPRLSRKYSWIKILAGYKRAYQIQQTARILRWKLAKWTDKALWVAEGKRKCGSMFGASPPLSQQPAGESAPGFSLQAIDRTVEKRNETRAT